MSAKTFFEIDTKPEFEGDYTLVLFPFIKQLKKSPEQLGNEIGDFLVKNNSSLLSFSFLLCSSTSLIPSLANLLLVSPD
mgnify:CR=1 FL=1